MQGCHGGDAPLVTMPAVTQEGRCTSILWKKLGPLLTAAAECSVLLRAHPASAGHLLDVPVEQQLSNHGGNGTKGCRGDFRVPPPNPLMFNNVMKSWGLDVPLSLSRCKHLWLARQQRPV